ncbi:MAG: hypothetical protein JNL74_21345, partial [Fibrobacteres bacterium]|nr:hypothetical protein [Fibrobacterota bacterium]
TDVAVSIVNVADSTVIRHLAAGYLGATAPEPLTKNSLSQTIPWDGLDDAGRTYTGSETNLRARVRAGMSTQLVSLLGGNPYTLGTTEQFISGIISDAQGNVYVAAAPAKFWHEHYGQTFLTVRKYDKEGNYVKTLFPMPANLPQSDVTGWSVVNNTDGSWTPKSTNTSLPMLTRNKLGYQYHKFNSKLQYIDNNGDLIFGDIETMAFGRDGKMTGTTSPKKLITSPAFATPNPAYSMQGEANLLPLKNGKLLLTGIFHFAGSGGTATQLAPDTNFWRDGKVFLLDPTTGVTTTWTSIDSVPKTNTERLAKLGGGAFYSALQGMASDSAGRIYVCDRVNQRITVFDTTARILGSLPVNYPHRVEVCGRTGSIYVLTQLQAAWAGGCNNIVKLIKYAPFTSGGAPVCTLVVANATMGRSGRSAVSSISVNDVGGDVTVWVGVWGQGIRMYRDNGTTFSLVKDMKAVSVATNELGAENPTPDRFQVDRNSGTLYFNNSWYNLYKITDWSNPVPKICSTTANKRLYAADVTIGGNGNMYVVEGTDYNAPVKRYTITTGRHAPVNWSNTGSNQLTPYVSSRFAPCSGSRGLDADRNGRVAVMAVSKQDRGLYSVGVYADSGSDSVSWGFIRANPVSALSGGVKFDSKGNLYFGAGIRQSTIMAPAQFLSDTGFKWGVGSIVRYDGNDTGSVNGTTATNATKVYDIPMSPFSADRLGGCVCRSPRFDLDPYGRLFVPDAITCQVSVADNAGNMIHRFGKYGNIDSRGTLSGLPTQEVINGSEVPLCFPTSAAATEDYIYVADFMNYRIAKVKMVYSADNIPGFSGKEVKA